MNIDTNNALNQNNSHTFTTQRLILFLSKFSLWAVIFLVGFSGKNYSEEKLKVATCQFPVSGNIKSNANYIKCFIKEAALNKADIVHFSEAALSGYPPKRYTIV